MRRADRERLDRIADALEAIGVECYRGRIALEVLAGDALERSSGWDHPAGADLLDLKGSRGDLRPLGPFG